VNNLHMHLTTVTTMGSRFWHAEVPQDFWRVA